LEIYNYDLNIYYPEVKKSRVSFAMAVWNNPHILIMDEPTNHLDIDAVNALIVALNNYSGGLIIVSHDQYFV